MDIAEVEVQRFLDLEWDYEPDGENHMGYYSVSKKLQEYSTQKTESGDVDQAAMLDLLARATSMMMEPDSINDPFKPYVQTPKGRSAYTEDELNFFEQIVRSIKEPWVTARIADVLWLTRRNKAHALLAIDSYIVRPISSDTWNRGEKNCWERAGRLCLMFKDQTRLDHITKNLYDAFQLDYPECIFMHLWLARLMEALKVDMNYLVEIAGKLLQEGLNNKADQEFEAARSYLSFAAKKFGHLNDTAGKTQCLLMVAEAFKEQGDFRLAGSAMVANSFYNDAIHAYRQLPRKFREDNDIDRLVDSLRKKLEETGIASLGEMTQVRSPGMDITKQQAQARAHVSGKTSVEEAILFFTGLVHPISIFECEAGARKNLQNSPIMAMVPSLNMALDGRVVAKVPGLNMGVGEDDPENKQTLEHQTLKVFSTHIHIVVQATVLPALNTLIVEHRLSRDLIQSLCEQSPIVPEGRERLLAHALWMGFEFDFASAIHLLCPQVEHMIRVQLKANGAITSKLEHGIETENGLSTLLKLEEAKKVFGEDLVFELEAIFSKVLGFNLRNEVSHGLLDDDTAASSASVYAWWLVLKLVSRSFCEQTPKQAAQ
jgi:hypothetical protein